MKDGHKTTEFWLTVAVAIAQTALAGTGVVNGTAASIGLTVTTLLYTVLRASAKSQAATLAKR